jgi:hypothetical protein
MSEEANIKDSFESVLKSLADADGEMSPSEKEKIGQIIERRKSNTSSSFVEDVMDLLDVACVDGVLDEREETRIIEYITDNKTDNEAQKILDLARNMIRLAGYAPEKDIPIVFTGLRPGEKLYEELLNQKETTLPTDNKKIMIARVREFDFDVVSKQIDILIETSYSDKPFTIVKQMKQLVPEYISNNSIYEQLDIR